MSTLRAAATFAALTVAAPAIAAPIIGVQTDMASPTGGAAGLGTGFAGTLGYGVELGLAEVIPEIGISWFGESRRLLPRAGGRLMVGKVVEPGVYAHVVFADGLSLAPGRAGWDAGVLLDLTVIPHLDIGVHVGALTLPAAQAERSTHVVGGLHLGVVF
ncbi:MAG: hypothetical protein ACI9K2_000292 [Myxococcota bacterium]|jgi:hypothetical protein